MAAVHFSNWTTWEASQAFSTQLSTETSEERESWTALNGWHCRCCDVARARLQSLAKQMHHAIEKGLPKLALWSTHDSASVAAPKSQKVLLMASDFNMELWALHLVSDDIRGLKDQNHNTMQQCSTVGTVGSAAWKDPGKAFCCGNFVWFATLSCFTSPRYNDLPPSRARCLGFLVASFWSILSCI